MPRGPGKSANYNLDYSRFNYLDAEEQEEPKLRKAPEPEEKPTDDVPEEQFGEILGRMPPELQEAYRLMQISRETGDEKAQQRANELALKAVERGGPEVKKTFLKEVKNQLPEGASPALDELDGLDGLDGLDDELPQNPTESVNALEGKIGRMKAAMEEGKAATKVQLDSLAAQQAQLENMSSPEDFMKFMQQEGMSNEDMQRMFTGDTGHMEEMVTKMMDKATGTGGAAKSLKKAESMVKEVETLHKRIFADDSPEGVNDEPAPVSETKATPPKPKRETPKEEQIIIPTHRLQYQKDEGGRYTAVELVVQLPGVSDMSAIVLDVAEKHLRLSTVAPAPGYAVNAGPFPVLIEPSAARAKFSKKRQELSLTVPAKA